MYFVNADQAFCESFGTISLRVSYSCFSKRLEISYSHMAAHIMTVGRESRCNAIRYLIATTTRAYTDRMFVSHAFFHNQYVDFRLFPIVANIASVQDSYTVIHGTHPT